MQGVQLWTHLCWGVFVLLEVQMLQIAMKEGGNGRILAIDV